MNDIVDTQTQEANTAAEAAEPKKRGAKPILERTDKLKSALTAINAGAPQEGESMPSRFIQYRLAEAGLVEFQQVKEEGRRGRPRNVPHLTPAGAVMLETL